MATEEKVHFSQNLEQAPERKSKKQGAIGRSYTSKLNNKVINKINQAKTKLSSAHQSNSSSLATSPIQKDGSPSRAQKAFHLSFQANKMTKAFGGKGNLSVLSGSKIKDNSAITTINGEDTPSGVRQSMLKDMIENATSEQRAFTLIDDTLELFTHHTISENGKGNEKYELIDKEEFEKMKSNNELFKVKKKNLMEEYENLKESLEKVKFELGTMNFVYYNMEKAKIESLTKIYSMENELKKIIIKNTRLQYEIEKEVQQKNNVFRALNDFKKKYDVELPKEINDIYKKISDENYNYIPNVNSKDKFTYLNAKIEQMTKELNDKDVQIETLTNKVRSLKEN